MSLGSGGNGVASGSGARSVSLIVLAYVHYTGNGLPGTRNRVLRKRCPHTNDRSPRLQPLQVLGKPNHRAEPHTSVDVLRSVRRIGRDDDRASAPDPALRHAVVEKRCRDVALAVVRMDEEVFHLADASDPFP